MRLTRVVLPAPFGPISPATLPVRTSIDRSDTAATPPKCLAMAATSSSGVDDSAGERQGAPSATRFAAARVASVSALRAARRNRMARGSTSPRGRKIMISSSTMPLATSWKCGNDRLGDHRQRGEHGRADDRADPVVRAAEHDRGDHGERDVDEVGVGREELQHQREQHPAQAADRARDHEGDGLDAARRDAEARRDGRVLAHRARGDAEPRDRQAVEDRRRRSPAGSPARTRAA